MKKILYSSLILGSAFALASCSADEPGAKGDGNVSLTVQLPAELATRFAEASSINTLYYSICSTGENAAVLDSYTQQWPVGQTATTVDLQLVPGQSYQVVFFAMNDAATAYQYDQTTADLKVTYGEGMINNDAYDAFYAVETLTSADAGQKTITLNRPFAQLNIGTNDLEKGVVTNVGLDNYTSSLEITSGLLSGINFLSGATTAQTAAVTFPLTSLANEVKDEYPVPGYSYLEMNYLLVDPAAAGASLAEATYTVTAAGAEVNNLNLANLPLRANYQTNVYGALLTTKNTFNVEINPAFGEPDYNNEVVATTVDALTSALNNPAIDEISIPENTSLDISNEGNIMITTDKVITNKGTIVNDGTGSIRASGEGVTVTLNGGEYHNTENANFMLVSKDGATLNVNDAKLTADKKTDGTMIALMDNGNVNLNNVVVDVNFCAVQTWDGFINGHVNAKNCTFISRSENDWEPWSYCFNINGDSNEAVLEDCTILGVQGAVAANSGGKVTLNNCICATFQPEDKRPSDYVVYYPVYTANSGIVNINSGYFYSENPSGLNVYQAAGSTINIMGGYFNLTPWNPDTKGLLAPATGFEYKTVDVTKSIPTPWGETVEATFNRQAVAQ